jgi:hypothetical protein
MQCVLPRSISRRATSPASKRRDSRAARRRDEADSRRGSGLHVPRGANGHGLAVDARVSRLDGWRCRRTATSEICLPN